LVGKTYIITGPTNAFESTQVTTVTSTATCNPGDTVLSGGYVLNTNGNAASIQQINFHPDDSIGWTTSVTAPTPGITTIAVCFDNP
jgi:hypothetical protein